MIKEDILDKASNMLKSIAHPVRFQIIGLLENGINLSVSEIQKQLSIDQAAASHHLNIMKDKGVLVSERDGKQVLYSLKYQKLSNIVECITECCKPTR